MSFPDPVAAGMVISLARPGGNVTGLSGLNPELNTKRLEILRDAVPKLSRVGVLRQAGTPESTDLPLNELRAAAPVLKIRLEEIQNEADAKGLESAFEPKAEAANAIMPGGGRVFFGERKRIVELAGKYRLPAIYAERTMSMRVASCPTGQTTMSSIGTPLFTWTRF